MDERVKFIAMYLRGEHALSELCQHFGISRKTAYKWLQRYAGGGVASLVDKSKRPHHSPNAVMRINSTCVSVASPMELPFSNNAPEPCAPPTPMAPFPTVRKTT